MNEKKNKEANRLHDNKTTTEQRREEFKKLYNNKIGLCNCGSFTQTKNLIYDIINIQKKYQEDEEDNPNLTLYEQRRNLIDTPDKIDILLEIVLHILYKANILEHGSSINWAWLDTNGYDFLELLKEFKDEWD